jgi:polar amino acid transport system substrate-binding protein/glutamate/aspartate transport system substrate-binding protein
MPRFAVLLVAVFTLAVSTAVSGAAAGTLDRIRDKGVLKIGFREDAEPFSYRNAIGEPAGYSVGLCRAVAASIKQMVKREKLSVEYVPVTAENRFQAVKDGRIDLLCGPTTATLSRREIVDFSLPTFVDGASVLLREDGPENFGDLDGRKVGVRAGTTTEEALRNTVEDLAIKVETVAVKDHKDGVARLLKGEIAAYFADRAILYFLMRGSASRDKLFLSDQQFTYEPYALALPKGDTEFRLAVDRALSRIYRSGEISTIFTAAFGPGAEPTEELSALWRISTLPE